MIRVAVSRSLYRRATCAAVAQQSGVLRSALFSPLSMQRTWRQFSVSRPGVNSSRASMSAMQYFSHPCSSLCSFSRSSHLCVSERVRCRVWRLRMSDRRVRLSKTGVLTCLPVPPCSLARVVCLWCSYSKTDRSKRSLGRRANRFWM